MKGKIYGKWKLDKKIMDKLNDSRCKNSSRDCHMEEGGEWNRILKEEGRNQVSTMGSVVTVECGRILTKYGNKNIWK